MEAEVKSNNGYEYKRGLAVRRVTTINPPQTIPSQRGGIRVVQPTRTYHYLNKQCKIEPSKLITQNSNTPGLDKAKALPASKFETFWLKGRIQAISTTIQTLNANLTRVSNGVPEVDDKFNIKSKMISLTSLLNIGANQITTCTKELENDWDKVLETKSFKTSGTEVINPSDLRYPLETEVFDEDFYLQKFNIQPCSVELPRIEEVINID